MMLLSFLILPISGFITHDTGLFDQYNRDDWSFLCENGFERTKMISFSDSFANPPQIILSLEKFDVSQTISENTGQYQVVDMNFQIQSVTTTCIFFIYIKPSSFTLSARTIEYMLCTIVGLQQMIKEFKYQVNLTMSIKKTETFSHENPNALSGFVSLISYGYKGPLSFNVMIDSITSTEVTISISDTDSLNENILSLGYQIVLAAPEFINKIDTVFNTATWTSQSIPVLPNTFFLTPLQGLTYQNNDNMRIKVNYITTDPIVYQYECWYGIYAKNTHQQVQLYYSISKTYLPLICNHMRISQNGDPFVEQTTSVSLNILETNQNFAQIGSQTVAIDESFNQINFVIQTYCQKTQNVESKIYFHQSNQILQKSQTKYCNTESNVVTFHTRFQQQTIASQLLKIDITQSSIEITQILNNQVKSQQIIAKIQVINK